MTKREKTQLAEAQRLLEECMTAIGDLSDARSVADVSPEYYEALARAFDDQANRWGLEAVRSRAARRGKAGV